MDASVPSLPEDAQPALPVPMEVDNDDQGQHGDANVQQVPNAPVPTAGNERNQQSVDDQPSQSQGNLRQEKRKENEQPAEQIHDDENEPRRKRRRLRYSEIRDAINEPASPRSRRIRRHDQLRPPPEPIGKLEEDPPHWTDDPVYAQLGSDDPEMAMLLEAEWRRNIRTREIETVDPEIRKYNLRLDNDRMQLNELLVRIHYFQQTAYHANLEFGCILQNKMSDELRYFHGADNTRVFDQDRLIRSRNDLRQMIADVQRYDAEKEAFHLRPDTKWVLKQLTNVVIKVTRMPRVMGGKCSNMKFPSYVRRNRGLVNFIIDANKHKIADRLCFFRCLAYHKTAHDPALCNRYDPETKMGWRRLNILARYHYTKFKDFIRKSKHGKLRGMPLDMLDEAERYADIPIYIYRLKPYINELPEPTNDDDEDNEHDPVLREDKEAQERAKLERLTKEAIKKNHFCAEIVRQPAPEVLKSEHDDSRAMHLNLFTEQPGSRHAHFSYIENVDLYCKAWICVKCNRCFHKSSNAKRHEGTCQGNRVQNSFPGYGFNTKPTIFEKLEHKYDIKVPDELRYHPHWAVYDWECMFHNRTTLQLEPLDFGEHLSLPETEDPDEPPEGLAGHIRDNWASLYSRVGACNEYAVVRAPAPTRVADYMKATAKLQRRPFRMKLKVWLFANGRMYEHKVGDESELITSVDAFNTYWESIEPQLTRNALGKRKIQAMRVVVHREQQSTTADLIPASCAIATNVPGFSDPVTGQPEAKFLLSNGDTKALVREFAHTLQKMARKSGRIMLKRFGPVLRRLDKLWRERYLREIYMIMKDFIDEEKPLYVVQIAENTMTPKDQRDETLDYRLKLMKKRLSLMNEWSHLDELLFKISVRTTEQKQKLKQRLHRLKYPKLSAHLLELDKKVIHFFNKVRVDMDPAKFAAYRNACRKIKDIRETYKELETYCVTLSTFGFNSAKFDLNLIRDWLVPELHRRSERPLFKRRHNLRLISESYANFRMKPTIIKMKPTFNKLRAIKRGNAYLSLQSTRLRFLDCTNFIAAGTSYSSWLASRQVDAGEKFFFPYEWFTSLDQLDEQLPPQTAFYSSMKDEGISDEDYEKVQRKWRESGWQTMRDHLEFYNKQASNDVVPFLEGIKSMRQFFKKECKIDMIGGKAISLPGIAEERIYNTVPPHVNFVLPQKTRRVDNSDLHSMIKEGIVGGPAITFRRYAEVGKTRIRYPKNGKICRTILGFDANSLYLKCTKEKMPCQLPRRWDKQEDGSFRASAFYKYRQTQTEWLEWESLCRGTKIYHVFNGGIDLFGATQKWQKPEPEMSDAKDVRILGISVDGYDPTTKTCFFMDGCKWHYHRKFDENGVKLIRLYQCPITCAHKYSDEDFRKATQKWSLDKKKREQLMEAGYKVVVMHECDWLDYQRVQWDAYQMSRFKLDYRPGQRKPEFADPTPQTYIDHRTEVYPAMYEGVECKATDDTRLRKWLHDMFYLPIRKPIKNWHVLYDHIMTELFFGVVEVDIEVHPSMRNHFAELTPIFKNVNIEVKDIGPHMQRFVKRHRYENKFPRRSLVGSYHAYKVPMTTPLLRWYMRHGVMVKNIHKAFQFKPIACFENFGKLIEESRRKSDADPLWGPSGEMDKLIGNAGYGKSITDLMRHMKIEVCTRPKMREKQRNPFFKTMEPLADKLYEVSMSKKKHEHNLFNLFGFFVYNYAKMKMLSFFYDFIDKFISRKDYELILMDTDSFYLALSGKSLDELVPASKRTAYEAVRNKFLPRRDEPGKTHDRRVPGLFKISAALTLLLH